MNCAKKLVSMLLALMLVFTMACAVAEEGETATAATYSITIANKNTGHTYEAYQIFEGDISKNADNDAIDGTQAVLSNIVWGEGVTYTGEGVNITDADGNVTKSTAAADIAEALANSSLKLDAFLNDITLTEVAAQATAPNDAGNYVISGLEPGYYLVKDKKDSLGSTVENEAYTEFIIEVVENSTVKPKSSVPTVEKKVDDINDSNTSEDGETWQDSADYDVDDSVPFKITATLADNVTSYDTYKIVFHDTLSAGLTYNNDAVVMFGETNVTSFFKIEYKDTKLNISCDDVTKFGATDNSVITVEYTAKLNEDAVVGSAGNTNKVYLEYSNDPNWKPEGEDDDEPTGNTPEDTVIVFTYKVIVNKVDESNDPLAGAGFTLYKYDADATTEDKWVAVGEEVTGEAMTEFEWSGLDDGNYKLVETTTPTGYNTINPIEFTITAEHTNDDANPALSSLSGGELFTADVTAGSLTANIVNKAGTTLPETGGAGTTMLYVGGGALIAVAVAMLVAKKRKA